MSTPREDADNTHAAILHREQAWYVEGKQRRDRLDVLLYDPPAFDDMVYGGLDFLPLRQDEPVLDMGCGEGKEVELLADQGYTVVAVDLSPDQLALARGRLGPEAKAPHFILADAEALPFAAGTFRAIYSKATLHHMDLVHMAKEVQRLLKPGGRATFAEPLAHHPLFWLARRLTPQLRTQDEHPLRLSEMAHFGASFAAQVQQAYFLFAPLAYAVRILPGGERAFASLHALLQRIDRWLFRRLPPLRHLAWYVRIDVKRNE